MARNCPKDQVRALVEGTVDLDDSLAQDVTAHIEGCASCRKLKAKLESRERAFRSALASFGAEDSSRCPSVATLASLAESGIESADAGLVDHLARCAMCRSSLAPAKVDARANQGDRREHRGAHAPDETIAAARRRVATTRTKSDEQPIAQPGRLSSGRRLRTGRSPALVDAPSNKAGLLVASVAVLFATFAVFLAVQSPSTPDTTATPSNPTPKPAPSQQPAPQQQAPKPSPSMPPQDDVVAQSHPSQPLPPVEEEPREPENVPGPEVQKPDPTVAPEQPKSQPPVAMPAPTTPRTDPRSEPKPEPKPEPRPEPAVLACKVEAVTGPVEIRKKSEKSWRRLTVAELVHDGDGLRSKGEDGSLTFSGKAKVTFAGDASGTVTIKSTGICVSLDSGSLDGESLAYDGLEVRELNGFVTAWKGSKVRVEATAQGLRVIVEKGTANAGNDLGKVTVHSAHEVTIQKDRRPSRPTPRR